MAVALVTKQTTEDNPFEGIEEGVPRFLQNRRKKRELKAETEQRKREDRIKEEMRRERERFMR